MTCTVGTAHKACSESLRRNGSQADSEWLICPDDWWLSPTLQWPSCNPTLDQCKFKQSSMLLAPCLGWGRGGWCRKMGTRRRKATYHLQNDIKRKENPTGWTCSRREKAFHCRPDSTEKRRGFSDTIPDRHPIYKKKSERWWVDATTNDQRTSHADSITRQTSSISLSLYCQGMRAPRKVTLTKCLGVSWEKRHWHYINFMSLF